MQPETIGRHVEQAKRFQIALAEAGIAAYTPNLHDITYEKLSSETVRRTLKVFSEWVLAERADALAVMPGWENSAGTKVEIDSATRRHIPIFYLSAEVDLTELKSWYNS